MSIDVRRWIEVPHFIFLNARKHAGRQQYLAAPDELDPDARLFVSPDLTAGFAIQPDNELTQVFNYGPKGQGAAAVRAAITLGANHLNCFDGYLTGYYERLGFTEVERVPFDPALAPEDWSSDDGTPDVVFMARTPLSTEKEI